MSKEKYIPQKYIDKIISKNAHAVILTDKYKNDSTMINLHCTKHDVYYSQSLKNAMRGNGCEECQRDRMSYTQEEFISLVHKKNPHIKVLGEYTKQGCHVLCECKIHKIKFNPNSVTLLHGSGGCPECFNEQKSRSRIGSDNIKRMFNELNPTLHILDDNVKVNMYVTVHCDVCGNDFQKKLTPSYIHDMPCKCSVCANRSVVCGFNDVATVRPDLIKYFKDKNDAYTHVSGSTDIVKLVCPDCGYEKEMSVDTLSRQGFGCTCCGDGVSYPNKFIRSLMRQLNVDDVIFEYSPKWAGRYFYDCYFKHNGVCYIVETDGLQHFEPSGFGVDLNEIQKRDEDKNILARKNGHVLIRIDAKKSTKDYLVDKIKLSKLSNLFDLDIVDWDECDKFATSNLVKSVCLFAEKTMPDNYQEICNKFSISQNTARKYLLCGVKFGWCSYRPIEKLTTAKLINVYNKSGQLIHTFRGFANCAHEMSKIYNIKFNPYNISNNCRGTRSSYKDFIFKFAYNDECLRSVI